MPAKNGIQVRVTPEMREVAKESARRAGVSMQAWLDEAIKRRSLEPAHQGAASMKHFEVTLRKGAAPSKADMVAKAIQKRLGAADVKVVVTWVPETEEG